MRVVCHQAPAPECYASVLLAKLFVSATAETKTRRVLFFLSRVGFFLEKTTEGHRKMEASDPQQTVETRLLDLNLMKPLRGSQSRVMATPAIKAPSSPPEKEHN